jgi:hypothetical protein
MASGGLAFVGVLFVVILLCVSYLPISTRLAQTDIQSLSWGPAVYRLFPVFWVSFGIFFSLVTLKIATVRSPGNK